MQIEVNCLISGRKHWVWTLSEERRKYCVGFFCFTVGDKVQSL